MARLPIDAVARRLVPLIEEGLVATCAIVDLEVLFSSRNLADYESVLDERRGFEDVLITPDVMATSLNLQHKLARHGQHRTPISDLIISAAAKSAALTVLHYDSDFERIAAVGGAPHEWVVPQGSV